MEVRITPLPGAEASDEGFLPAELTVSDPNSELPSAVRALTVRRAAGGPTLFYQASVAPGQKGRFRVLLPMISVHETFVVRLLNESSPSGAVLARRDVGAATDNVAGVEAARGRLIDPPAYDEYIDALPNWPAWTIRNVCIALAAILVALGAALLIRGPAWRVVAAGAVVAGATAAVYLVLSDCPVVDVRRSGCFLVVTARRTVTWSHPAEGIAPVYWRPQQMNADDMVYQPGKTLTTTLHPYEVRLLRRVEQAGP